jgi:hypothetical protein
MRSVSVELKLAFAVIAASVTAGLAGARIAGGIFERNVEAAGLATLQRATDGFAAQERSEVEKLASTIDSLLVNEDLRDAFVARDRARLLRVSKPLFEEMRQRDRITHWYFIEPEPARTVFLRVHKPELSGDRVDRATLQKAIETRDLGAGKELGRTAFALRVVRPWISEGVLIGYMELAEEIDHFLTAMKALTGDDYGLLVKKKFLDEQAWARVLGPRSNTWNDRPDVVVVDTTTFTEGIIDFEGDLETIPDRGSTVDEVIRGDRAYVRGIFPVRDAAGRKVGGMFVLRDFSANHSALRAAVVQTFLAMFALALLSSAAVVAGCRWLIFRRLHRLRQDLEVHAAEIGVPPGRALLFPGEDEIGQLEALFRRVLSPPSRATRREETIAPAPGGAAADTGH